MPLYKIVKTFFIPPGIFIVIFILLALYFILAHWWNKKRYYKNGSEDSSVAMIGFSICLCSAILVYSLSINAVSQRFMHSLEYKYSRGNVKVDAVFVLGGGYNQRIQAGVKLQKAYNVDVVVSGYNGEAESMQNLLLKGGVINDKIIVEPKATNTKDHVTYMLPIALEKGYKRIYLVTDANHMPRSMMNFYVPFKNKGIEVLPYPCRYTVPKEHREDFRREWIPNIYSLQQSAEAWHEYLGMLELWIIRLF